MESYAVPPPAKILIVDDLEQNLLATETLLARPDVQVLRASSGPQALERSLEHDLALILLDVQMPGMDGFETATLLRGRRQTRLIPIIFITANQDPHRPFKGYETGAVDYLFKPVDPDVLKQKVQVFVDLYRQRQTLELTTQALQSTLADLRNSKQVIEAQNLRLNELSIRDGLTGLFNHRHLFETLQQEFSRARRYGTDLACLLADIDHFKEVNDTCGHAFGDVVLKGVAQTLHANIRQSDFLARYGGEEFVILMPNTDIGVACKAAEKLRHIVETTPFSDASRERSVTISIGIASAGAGAPGDAEALFSNADKALYAAKNGGRNQVSPRPPEADSR